MAKPTGYILFEGPSVLDGQPIVVVATMKTKNEKTGAMVQTWILRADMTPLDAVDAKADASICGGCPHRRSLGGACYVNIGQAPQAVYKAYKRGSYSRDWSADTFKGLSVRLGAYGDPAAVPAAIWGEVLAKVTMHTGYTHQLGHKAFQPELLQWLMVSSDTPKAAAMHHKFGRRTFRVKTVDAPALPGEIECLSDAKGTSCADCGLCAGSGQDAPNVYINVHGSLAGRYENKYGKANLIPALAVA